jgi:P-type conjugative transfer protein TrbJ
MKRFTLFAVLSVLVLSLATAHAQFAVIDVANLVQNILAAARMVEEIDNQITQIQQGIQMLENQARNLQNLPFSITSALNADINAVNQLMGQAQGLVFRIGQIDQQFQLLYPASYASASDAQLIQDAQTRWQVSLQGLQHAMDVQSQIVANLPDDQQQMNDLVGQSQSAVGALEAVQAGNQLVALNTKQMLQLQALIASQARMQATEMARQAADAGAAAEQTSRFIGTGPVYTPVPVQAFH